MPDGVNSTAMDSTLPSVGSSLRQLRQQLARKVGRKEDLAPHSDASDSESGDELEDPSIDFESSVNVSTEKDEAAGTDCRAKKQKKTYVCPSCGLSVSKPALLTQHMRSHSDEKSFACPESGCGCAYKRQDHLNRHMKMHQGVFYFCSWGGCHQSFVHQAGLNRHLKYHREKADFPRVKSSGEKTLLCPKPGCGKSFRYPSLLQTHVVNVHEKITYASVFCVYPGCGDKFQTEKALVEHAEVAHPSLLCEICGDGIPRKFFKRHLRMHATKEPAKISCPHDGCAKTYTRESNLMQHVRSAHLKLKPFACSHQGCCKTFAHKSTRDRHEVSPLHLPPRTDFEHQDQLRLAKSRGGRKPVTLGKVEDLYNKTRG